MYCVTFWLQKPSIRNVKVPKNSSSHNTFPSYCATSAMTFNSLPFRSQNCTSQLNKLFWNLHDLWIAFCMWLEWRLLKHRTTVALSNLASRTYRVEPINLLLISLQQTSHHSWAYFKINRFHKLIKFDLDLIFALGLSQAKGTKFKQPLSVIPPCKIPNLDHINYFVKKSMRWMMTLYIHKTPRLWGTWH